MGARKLGDVPVFLGTTLEETQRRITDFLDDLQQANVGPPTAHGPEHQLDGDDPISSPGTPRTVFVGGTADAGSGPGFMAEDAQLVVSRGTPVAIGMANAAGVSSSGAGADHVHATPLTTNGDLMTVVAGVLARLGIGANGTALTVSAGALSWVAAPTVADVQAAAAAAEDAQLLAYAAMAMAEG